MMIVTSGSRRWLILFAHMAVISSKNLENFIQRFLKKNFTLDLQKFSGYVRQEVDVVL
ncbi:hypothetical protein [Klebsiella pneumoniae]|uniref:hypothetical protein n=1 Tax=Klebsiella pneumoniae TaxID=573 RepID=UPI000AF08D1A|nr:hypothetical protein [Klebsiella pneumoniae]